MKKQLASITILFMSLCALSIPSQSQTVGNIQGYNPVVKQSLNPVTMVLVQSTYLGGVEVSQATATPVWKYWKDGIPTIAGTVNNATSTPRYLQNENGQQYFRDDLPQPFVHHVKLATQSGLESEADSVSRLTIQLALKTDLVDRFYLPNGVEKFLVNNATMTTFQLGQKKFEQPWVQGADGVKNYNGWWQWQYSHADSGIRYGTLDLMFPMDSATKNAVVFDPIMHFVSSHLIGTTTNTTSTTYIDSHQTFGHSTSLNGWQYTGDHWYFGGVSAATSLPYFQIKNITGLITDSGYNPNNIVGDVSAVLVTSIESISGTPSSAGQFDMYITNTVIGDPLTYAGQPAKTLVTENVCNQTGYADESELVLDISDYANGLLDGTYSALRSAVFEQTSSSGSNYFQARSVRVYDSGQPARLRVEFTLANIVYPLEAGYIVSSSAILHATVEESTNVGEWVALSAFQNSKSVEFATTSTTAIKQRPDGDYQVVIETDISTLSTSTPIYMEIEYDTGDKTDFFRIDPISAGGGSGVTIAEVTQAVGYFVNTASQAIITNANAHAANQNADIASVTAQITNVETDISTLQSILNGEPTAQARWGSGNASTFASNVSGASTAVVFTGYASTAWNPTRTGAAVYLANTNGSGYNPPSHTLNMPGLADSGIRFGTAADLGGQKLNLQITMEATRTVGVYNVKAYHYVGSATYQHDLGFIVHQATETITLSESDRAAIIEGATLGLQYVDGISLKLLSEISPSSTTQKGSASNFAASSGLQIVSAMRFINQNGDYEIRWKLHPYNVGSSIPADIIDIPTAGADGLPINSLGDLVLAVPALAGKIEQASPAWFE